MYTLSILALSLAGVATAKPLSTSTYRDTRQRAPWAAAPLLAETHPHGSVNNSYIVIFKEDVGAHHVENHMNFLQVTHYENPLFGHDDHGVRRVYDGHIRGYNGKFSAETVDAIRQMPEVAYVEADQVVHTMETQRSAPWVSHVRVSAAAFGLTGTDS
jgi:cerevisin